MTQIIKSRTWTKLPLQRPKDPEEIRGFERATVFERTDTAILTRPQIEAEIRSLKARAAELKQELKELIQADETQTVEDPVVEEPRIGGHKL